jgi:hypothetical protein
VRGGFERACDEDPVAVAGQVERELVVVREGAVQSIAWRDALQVIEARRVDRLDLSVERRRRQKPRGDIDV